MSGGLGRGPQVNAGHSVEVKKDCPRGRDQCRLAERLRTRCDSRQSDGQRSVVKNAQKHSSSLALHEESAVRTEKRCDVESGRKGHAKKGRLPPGGVL